MSGNNELETVKLIQCAQTEHEPQHSDSVFEVALVSNHCENYHVHDWPGRTLVIDSRQLIPFTFSVQTGQLA